MAKVLELKGYKSLRALNAFHALMLGVKMLPAYMSESYEEFLEKVQSMSDEDQEKIIREAALFVKIEKEELDALVSFCADPNGVPYGPENIGSLSPDKLLDVIVSVCKEIAKIKIDIITEAEKKN